MPIKRVIAKARRTRITSEAVAAFQAGDWLGLHGALNLKPWEASPLDVEPSDKDLRSGSMWHRSVDQALNLRSQLVQAGRPLISRTG